MGIIVIIVFLNVRSRFPYLSMFISVLAYTWFTPYYLYMDMNITIYTVVVTDTNNDGTPDYLDPDTN